MYQTPSGNRRSRRLASREPSVAESDTTNDSIGLFPPLFPSSPVTQKQLLNVSAHAFTRAQENVAAAFDPSSTISSISRGNRAIITKLTKAQLLEVVKTYAERDAASQRRISSLEQDLEHAEENCVAAVPSRGQYSMKMAEIMRKHKEEQAEAEAAAAKAAPPPPAPATTQSASSPAPITPSAAVTASPGAAPPTSVWRSITNLFSTPFSRKRAAEDEPASSEPSQKRQKPIQPTPATVKKTTSTPRRPVTEQPTPRTAVKDSPVPAPPATEQPSTTPVPKRKRTTATATATPLPAIPESSPKAPMTAITPRRRTLASVRATKSAVKPQQEKRYVWEATPKVKEPNADSRLAKIRLAESLRRQLAQLEQDEEVLRKTKKVKVDHLTEIPHNRPGDPSSMFRVPDIDSDDEIEVDTWVEERTNIFETPQPSTQAATTPAAPPTALPATQPAATPATRPPQLPPQQPTSALPPTSQLPAQQATTPLPTPSTQQTPKARPQASRFSFPDVGPRPADYSVTPAYQDACRVLFAEGLAAF